jgi:hypothetical protein
MTLADPREALADQSEFVSYLMGLAGVAELVDSLAADDNRQPGSAGESHDFVYALLGLASIGAAIKRLADYAVPQGDWAGSPSAFSTTRWLR